MTRSRLLLGLALAGGLAAFVGAMPVRDANETRAADATTVDGGRYFGSLSGGMLHGHGRLVWDNGSSYEGEFVRGRFAGKGRLRLATGIDYSGDFVDGHMRGHGRMQMADGAAYVGEFRDDAFDGDGRYESSDGEVYVGGFAKGVFSGKGRLVTRELEYRGEFRAGRFDGYGEIDYKDGRRYRGSLRRGLLHGPGRFTNAGGDVYAGDFADDAFAGLGTLTRRDGSRHEGRFVDWWPQGPGRYQAANGDVFEGDFDRAGLQGPGRARLRSGATYVGEFKDWRYAGKGRLALANGDSYEGEFAHGQYHGHGTLRLAASAADAAREKRGLWRYGRQVDDADERRALLATETALYGEGALLDRTLATLAPRAADRINLYLLAVAGDGSQEVFRREVEFVREQFDRDFGTRGRSLALINSRTTVGVQPMATVGSLRASLQAIATQMDREQDILFLFLTSHGSEQHELVLNQNHLELRGLPAAELRRLLHESGIRWRVVVVSACYSGGFIDALRDDGTLVIAAARRDRRSFGCADDNDFTYFGRAYFKEALPRSASFAEAFRRAEALVGEWEKKELPAGAEDEHSLPQISNPPAIDRHLQRWWAQARNGAPIGMAAAH